MRFMNECDLIRAIRTFVAQRDSTPNRLHIAAVVDRLHVWADHNSDGWAYWPKPARAAAKAMEEIDATTWERRAELLATDATDAEVTAALRPIKSFCTRQVREGNMTPDDRDWILGAVGVTSPLRTSRPKPVWARVTIAALYVAAAALLLAMYLDWQRSYESAIIGQIEQQPPATVAPEQVPILPTCTKTEPGEIPGSALIERRDGEIVRTRNIDKAFDQAAFDNPDLFPNTPGVDHGIRVIDFCKEQ